ncbi:MAG TPA: hypothetical protein VD978_32495 [Azospirillum sp.]|nr:hypothetical protein [Azospirillum sp.]
MLRSPLLAALAATLVPSSALAEEVQPGAAYTVLLKDHYTAVVYYMDSPDGFLIVTTMAAGSGPAVRFTNHLLAGQSATLEASGEVGAPSSRVLLSRIGDVLNVTPLPEAEAKVATDAPETTYASSLPPPAKR